MAERDRRTGRVRPVGDQIEFQLEGDDRGQPQLGKNLTASRVSAEKIRKFRVFGSRLYASCDFLTRQAQVAKLVVGEGGAPEIKMESIGAPAGDPESEPLRRQAIAFVRAITEKTPPVVSGEDGVAVLRMAKEILDKMSMGPNTPA